MSTVPWTVARRSRQVGWPNGSKRGVSVVIASPGPALTRSTDHVTCCDTSVPAISRVRRASSCTVRVRRGSTSIFWPTTECSRTSRNDDVAKPVRPGSMRSRTAEATFSPTCSRTPELVSPLRDTLLSQTLCPPAARWSVTCTSCDTPAVSMTPTAAVPSAAVTT